MPPSDHPDPGADRGDLVRRYFEACSAGSADEISDCFGADAVIYDLNLAPVRGARACGAFWLRVRERWDGARWTIDRIIAAGDEAACEWTMTGRDGARPVRFRGSDHYHFDGDLISEVRQYWRFDDDRLVGGLIGYPYDELPPVGPPGARRPTETSEAPPG